MSRSQFEFSEAECQLNLWQFEDDMWLDVAKKRLGFSMSPIQNPTTSVGSRRTTLWLKVKMAANLITNDLQERLVVLTELATHKVFWQMFLLAWSWLPHIYSDATVPVKETRNVGWSDSHDNLLNHNRMCIGL